MRVFFWYAIRTAYNLTNRLSGLDDRFLNAGGADGQLQQFFDLVLSLGVQALLKTRMNVVECMENPRPAWKHVLNEAQLSLSVPQVDKVRSDISSALGKGYESLKAFHGRRRLRR